MRVRDSVHLPDHLEHPVLLVIPELDPEVSADTGFGEEG
jgi:hypothetical protein